MKQKSLSSFSAFVFGSFLTLALTLTATTLRAGGSVSGLVWDDLNTNGIQDPGEPGIPDVWVFLLSPSGATLAVTISTPTGHYAFPSIAAYQYGLRFANPGGLWQTLKDQGNDDSKDNDADPFGYTDKFDLADGQALDFDAGFTTVAQGCFTPVTITVSAISCDDNGTPDPNDDTFTFGITATGGTGPWGWDLLPDFMMIPYGTTQTFGPFQIIDGAVTITINDHDNPDCTATVTVTPPAPCSTPLPPDNDTLSLNCVPDISVTATGANGTVVTFNAPTTTATCPGGAVVTQIQGPASGSTFPVGSTDVCFAATDTCGNADTCCFKVVVNSQPPNTGNCDEKIIGCIKYELLDITLDADKNKTYRIRVTNNCTNKLIYTAFQLPDGVTAMEPANNSIYEAPSGREYSVRNPNYAPFYSIRFKSESDSISGGASDIFSYKLPAQSAPDYIHVIVRVYPKVFYEAHLNTFDCVPLNAPNNIQSDKPAADMAEASEETQLVLKGTKTGLPALKVYPNPTAGAFSADLTPWNGQSVKVSVLNGQGQAVTSLHTDATDQPLPVTINSNLPDGLYFIEVIPANGERRVQQFMLRR